MDSSSGVWTQHVFSWVSIICFTSLVSVVASQGVELQTISQVAARCGENVTLTCDASSSGKLDIRSFSWLAKNESVCEYEDRNPDTKVLCESTAEPQRHILTLTLLNVMPDDQGTYLCKLRSTLGVKSKTTIVIVQDCLESSGSSISETTAKCWFSGVYPSGIIKWSQGDTDLTDSASPQEDVHQDGRYKVSSSIDVKTGNTSQPFNCSLWIPSTRKQLSSQQLHMKGQQIRNGSSGSACKLLQWICITVEVMMVKFII